MSDVSFAVPGIPGGKGSVVKGRHGGYHNMSKAGERWEAQVASCAAALGVTLPAPYFVSLSFSFARPKRPANRWPSLDLDKLVRASLDGLVKGGLLADDRHVTGLLATKHYGEPIGCQVRIWSDDDRDARPGEQHLRHSAA